MAKYIYGIGVIDVSGEGLTSATIKVNSIYQARKICDFINDNFTGIENTNSTKTATIIRFDK